tara:strand:- start:108 stop:248 length:141 start_codon:yes stop_codon:yes gene_type:complete
MTSKKKSLEVRRFSSRLSSSTSIVQIDDENLNNESLSPSPIQYNSA